MKNKTSLSPGVSPLAYLGLHVKLLAGGFMVLFIAAVWFAAPSLRETAPNTHPQEIQAAPMPLTEKQQGEEVHKESGTDTNATFKVPD